MYNLEKYKCRELSKLTEDEQRIKIQDLHEYISTVRDLDIIHVAQQYFLFLANFNPKIIDISYNGGYSEYIRFHHNIIMLFSQKIEDVKVFLGNNFDPIHLYSFHPEKHASEYMDGIFGQLVILERNHDCKFYKYVTGEYFQSIDEHIKIEIYKIKQEYDIINNNPKDSYRSPISIYSNFILTVNEYVKNYSQFVSCIPSFIIDKYLLVVKYVTPKTAPDILEIFLEHYDSSLSDNEHTNCESMESIMDLTVNPLLFVSVFTVNARLKGENIKFYLTEEIIDIFKKFVYTYFNEEILLEITGFCGNIFNIDLPPSSEGNEVSVGYADTSEVGALHHAISDVDCGDRPVTEALHDREAEPEHTESVADIRESVPDDERSGTFLSDLRVVDDHFSRPRSDTLDTLPETDDAPSPTIDPMNTAFILPRGQEYMDVFLSYNAAAAASSDLPLSIATAVTSDLGGATAVSSDLGGAAAASSDLPLSIATAVSSDLAGAAAASSDFE